MFYGGEMMTKRLLSIFILGILITSFVACQDNKKYTTSMNKEIKEDKSNVSINLGKEEKKIDLHILREVQTKLEKNFSDYNIDIDKANGQLYWSPDNKYIMFHAFKEESAKPYSKDKNYKQYVVLLDFEKGQMFNIKQGYLMGKPSWSINNGKVAFNSDGIYLLDLAALKLQKISGEGFVPIFSPDQSKLAYYNKGVWMYYLNNQKNQQITKNIDDVPASWFSDNERIFIFRNNGKKLTDGAGYEQNLSILHTQNNGKYTDIIPNYKGKFRNAQWIEQDKILHLVAGWDDSYSDHIIDLKNGIGKLIEVKDLGNYSYEMDIKDNKIMIANDEKIDVYDLSIDKIKEYSIKEDTENNKKKRNSFHRWLPDGRILVWHSEVDFSRGEVIVVDMNQEIQQLVGGYISANGVYVSADGKVVALIENERSIRFFNVPSRVQK